jgi:hypothetical protein
MATRSDILRLKYELDVIDALRKDEQFRQKVLGTARQTEQATKKSAIGFSGVGAAITKATLAIGALTAAVAIVDRFADRARRVNEVSRAFDNLTARVDISSRDMLNRLQEASDGFVSNFDLMQQANNALILGLPVTADTMEELTDIAVRLGRAVGRDATSSIESMITGIGRQSRLMLDNLGIIVDTNKAYEDYAEALGVAVDELTDAQKKHAFFNETMDQAREKASTLGDDVVTLAGQWEMLTTAIGNAIDKSLDFIANRLQVLPTGGLFGLPTLRVLPPRQQPAGGGGADTEEPPGPIGFGIDEIVDAEREVAKLETAFGRLMELQAGGTLTQEQFVASLDKLREKAVELSELGFEPLTNMFVQVDETAHDITNRMEILATMAEHVAQGFGAVGSQLLFAAVAGKKTNASFKMLVADLAKTSFAQAIYHTALGVAALTKWGEPIYGPASKQFQAAAYFGAAGAALSVASRVIGTPGQGAGVGEDESLNTNPLPPLGGGGQAQEIHVFIEGTGFIQDTTEFAREIRDAIESQSQRGGI